MSKLNNSINRWNELVQLNGSSLSDARKCHVDLKKISHGSFFIGDNLILELRHSRGTTEAEDDPLNRVILILRPEFIGDNEPEYFLNLPSLNSTKLLINGINISGSAIEVAASAERFGHTVNKSTLTDIYGRQAFLLELSFGCGLEFRSKTSLNESVLYALYYMYRTKRSNDFDLRLSIE